VAGRKRKKNIKIRGTGRKKTLTKRASVTWEKKIKRKDGRGNTKPEERKKEEQHRKNQGKVGGGEKNQNQDAPIQRGKCVDGERGQKKQPAVLGARRGGWSLHRASKRETRKKSGKKNNPAGNNSKKKKKNLGKGQVTGGSRARYARTKKGKTANGQSRGV